MSLTDEQYIILGRVAAFWETRRPDPQLHEAMWRCPFCLSNDLLHQTHRLFPAPPENGPHRFKWRVDIVMKCMDCAHVWVHGIVVTESWVAEHGHHYLPGNRKRHWRYWLTPKEGTEP